VKGVLQSPTLDGRKNIRGEQESDGSAWIITYSFSYGPTIFGRKLSISIQITGFIDYLCTR